MINLPLGPVMVDVAGLRLSEDERDWLQSPSIGGVILFSRNFESREQVTALISEIHAIRSPHLLIAVDQEGGRVQRFKSDFTRLPPLNVIGQAYDKNSEHGLYCAMASGYIMAMELRQIGIDISFTPVLDIATHTDTVIGDRSFHHDPETLSLLALHYIEGMNDAGMQATAKHFPGHGNVLADSHFECPEDIRSLDSILASDIIPFKQLVKTYSGIMTAHIHFSQVDSNIPTYSDYWLNTILRSQLGFDGIIFSDDLSMQGAHGIPSPTARADAALAAGCDMVLVCNDPSCAETITRYLDPKLKQDIHCNQQRITSMHGQTPTLSKSEASIQSMREALADLM